MSKKPFYSEGLYFSCARCSTCCRYESGYVFLSKADVQSLVQVCRMEYGHFVQVYCRWVPMGDGKECLSLKEKAGFDCIFWSDGCTVYRNRPLQCRTFPFWASVLGSQTAWQMAQSSCPGMGQGEFHSGEEIEACLAEQQGEKLISRKNSGVRGV
ncbi:MAG: YkgJ family cysteine cluster protein [Treponema sp.]|jgi:Fe-S-cluster containining protein|nr:YkgJ family cysteine cluster protein [Treponema sp.]